MTTNVKRGPGAKPADKPNITPTNNADNKVATSFVQQIILNREAYIKNLVTGWADKEPLGGFVFFLEHGVETVFVPTCGADLELVFHFDFLDFVGHRAFLPRKQQVHQSIVAMWALFRK